MRRLQETFRPLGVAISLPSLRINEQLLMVGDLMNTDRHSGLTLAPEAARDDMRRRIGKPITNEDLYAGCRRAFENGFSRVKLYFMCGLPGEAEADLAGIIEMSETIARLGQEIRGRAGDGRGQRVELRAEAADAVPVEPDAAPRVFPQCPRVSAPPKAAAERATEVPRRRDEPAGGRNVPRRPPARRGDRAGMARGARFDGWAEQLRPELWWQALADAGIDVEKTLHLPCPADAALPWDHIGIRQGRGYLERECCLATEQSARQKD